MLNPKDTDANLLQKHRHQEAFSTSGVRRVHLFISFFFFFKPWVLLLATLWQNPGGRSLYGSIAGNNVWISASNAVLLEHNKSLPKADDCPTVEIMHEIWLCQIKWYCSILHNCIKVREMFLALTNARGNDRYSALSAHKTPTNREK